ncbi:hypothetical protein T310_5400 [Rasamsonia emersonii CBS 393.64]|uniref:Uncharacterized protein n=1 Tax=Rasamsonia emersonii (strain ATCC 16479 / CBS 393.64 / IMI 116815) TaxID=1408163 RepID=A0A0F4YQM7_RASE3|nr:hypothetical protein T310_5400 [Rasamsonia emersonii CBS 393.64]KKA20587.1 hypothetical protein T310_5400 [Rasamsonia emersonii CBS 393.64]
MLGITKVAEGGKKEGGEGGPRQLPLLANGHKAGAQPQSQTGSEEEAPGLETDNDVWGLAVGLDNVQLKGPDEGLMQGGIREDGQDILEQDSGRGEVRKLAQRSAESYLKTGEFGGAGGIGGGLSGDLGGCGIWYIFRRVLRSLRWTC